MQMMSWAAAVAGVLGTSEGAIFIVWLCAGILFSAEFGFHCILC